MSWEQSLTCAISQWNKKNIVISPDLDGIISGIILCHIYGSRIIGIYNTCEIIIFDDYTSEEVANALWIDHDIQNENIISIGHHLLQVKGEKLKKFNPYSFNPNVFFGLDWEQCFKNRTHSTLNKCPYSTVLMLIESLRIRTPNIGTKGYALLLQADGLIDISFEYRLNCIKWRNLMFRDNFIVNTLLDNEYMKPQYKWVHGLMIDDLKKLEVLNEHSSKSKTYKTDKSKEWNFCKGFQSLKDKQDPKMLEEIVKYICIQTGWLISSDQLPKKVTRVHKMKIQTYNPNSIDLTILSNKNVFSYAITFRDKLKVTVS